MIKLNDKVTVADFSGNTVEGIVVGKTYTDIGHYDVRLIDGTILMYVSSDKVTKI